MAEGVETEEQSRLFRLLNCDEMRGFLFSKPMPVEIFETRFLDSPLPDRAGDRIIGDYAAGVTGVERRHE
jgi:predicted signal transduction protein with EAL and GGDEF domain